MIKLTLTHKVRAMHAKQAAKVRKLCYTAAGRLTTAALGWQLGVNTAGKSSRVLPPLAG